MKNNNKLKANISSPTFNKLINQFIDYYDNANLPITIGTFQRMIKINSKIINTWKNNTNNNLYNINYNNYLELLDYYFDRTINITLSLSPKTFSHNSFWQYQSKYFPKTSNETTPSIVINVEGNSTKQSIASNGGAPNALTPSINSQDLDKYS